MSDSTGSTSELPDSLSRLYDDPNAVVDGLRERAGDPETAERVVCVYKALSNVQRIRLLLALRDGECCVCELQTALNAPQSTVATHLRCLTDSGLVRTRNDGRWTYYSVADRAVFDLIEHAVDIEGRLEATE